MEIPDYAWNDDPNGFALANYVNSYLPESIRVFSILPSQRSDPTLYCLTSKLIIYMRISEKHCILY